MSVDRTLRANDNNRTSGVGTFGYSYIQNQADSDQFNIKTRAAMGDPNAIEQLDPNDPENLTAEQVKAAHTLALREDRATQDRIETQKNAEAFLSEHPEFLDTVPNGQLLVNQARTMFGEGLLTVDNFEAAYEYLRTKTNFLALNKTVLAAQQKQASKQRYAAQRASNAKRITNLSEAEWETMPLEEIRRQDAIESQKRLQAQAERGGFDAV